MRVLVKAVFSAWTSKTLFSVNSVATLTREKSNPHSFLDTGDEDCISTPFLLTVLHFSLRLQVVGAVPAYLKDIR